MLFNSLAFCIFFPLVTALYFLLPHRWRWSMLLVASCVFYAFFIPKYLLILAFTIVVDYFAGILIETAPAQRKKLYLTASIVANVGVLGLFKYFDFFNGNIGALAKFLGWNYSIHTLNLILPVGLSFHTFQAMSYTIEVYWGNQKAERHFGIYSLYVMFYPQLVAGPIERPQNLLHQFREKHDFEYSGVTSGLRLMAWGLFKKVVVADNLSVYVKHVYNNYNLATDVRIPPQSFSGPVLALATVCFAFQVYCDFSGYSDIAIGTARVMGFQLMKNFNMPFHSKTIVELWRRWHISLTTWFRDYLFMPLGRKGVPVFLSLMIVYMVCGLWHGANWTFLLFGAIHGLFIIIGSLTQQPRNRLAQATGWSRLPQLAGCMKILITFSLFCITLVIFRASSVSEAMLIFAALPFGWSALFHHPLSSLLVVDWRPLAVGLAGALVVESIHCMQKRGSVSEWLARQPWWSRWALYYAITAIIFFLFEPGGDQFIYFQF